MGEAGPHRLVLLVEGPGDVVAVPALVRKLLAERQPWDCLFLDEAAIKIGGIGALIGSERNRANWLRKLGVAGLRPRTGAVLVVLDGDADSVEATPFCAAKAAKLLVQRGAEMGAGRSFSLACVFARQEFESWLIAGVESLGGRLLPDGREGVRPGVTCGGMDTDVAPRDAKGWLSARMVNGYKETQDQVALVSMVDLNAIRARHPRSFRRLENALDVLIHAVRHGRPILSPA